METIVTRFNKRYTTKDYPDKTYSYHYLNSTKHFTFFNLWIPQNLNNLNFWERHRTDYLHTNNTNNLVKYLESPENINSFLNTNLEKIYLNQSNASTPFKQLHLRVFEIFKKSIYYPNSIGNGAIYKNSDNNIEFKAILCVKQEYIRYFKLWLLTSKSIKDLLEYDVFYILIDKSFENELNINKQLKAVFNKSFGNLVKHYDVSVTFVDNLTKELLKTVTVPKFNTIKEYTTWLDKIKIEALKETILNGDE